jgi:hypothetical protein
MEKNEVIWTGKSGKKYTFTVYSKGTTFNEVDGNYIFAKNKTTSWEAVYIGEGDLKTRTQDKEHLKCAENKGFTHYHVHKNSDEKLRKAEETDLIEGNPECLFENGGCNKTIDG